MTLLVHGGSARGCWDWQDVALGRDLDLAHRMHASPYSGTPGDMEHVPLLTNGRNTGGQDISQKFT